MDFSFFLPFLFLASPCSFQGMLARASFSASLLTHKLYQNTTYSILKFQPASQTLPVFKISSISKLIIRCPMLKLKLTLTEERKASGLLSFYLAPDAAFPPVIPNRLWRNTTCCLTASNALAALVSPENPHLSEERIWSVKFSLTPLPPLNQFCYVSVFRLHPHGSLQTPSTAR